VGCMPVTCVTKSSRRAAHCFAINTNTQVGVSKVHSPRRKLDIKKAVRPVLDVPPYTNGWAFIEI